MYFEGKLKSNFQLIFWCWGIERLFGERERERERDFMAHVDSELQD